MYAAVAANETAAAAGAAPADTLDLTSRTDDGGNDEGVGSGEQDPGMFGKAAVAVASCDESDTGIPAGMICGRVGLGGRTGVVDAVGAPKDTWDN